MSARPIPVAVGILCHPDGRVLLARRPPGRPAAGFWEFPGGKAEPGEPLEVALARELEEELGVRVRSAWPWLRLVRGRAGRALHLKFFRVTAWEGEPRPREGQALAWVAPADPALPAPLLPKMDRVLASLRLPARYAITAAGEPEFPDFLPRLDRALASGVRLIQVREPAMTPEARSAFARTVVTRARRAGARVLVSADIGLALDVGADGVHLRSDQLMRANSPPPFELWGASCHDATELARAAELGACLAVLSPVLPTASHPEAAGIGWARFAALVAEAPMPVYALGGMRTELLDQARACGAHGIALMRGIW